MQIEEVLDESGTVFVKHKGQTLEFNYGKLFTTPKKHMTTEEEDKLLYTNQYLKALPENLQDEIFKYYTQAWETLQNTKHPEELIVTLPSAMIGIYSKLSFEDTVEWLKETDIRVHVDIRESFHSNPGEVIVGTEDRTYVAKDYLELIAFCVMLRIVLPILGDYLRTITSEVNRTTKTQWALLLLESTNLVNNVAYDKLQGLIHNAIPTEVNLSSSILSGNSSESFERWIVSVIVITTLTKARLSGRSKTPKGAKLASLVSMLYFTAYNKSKAAPKNFGTSVHPKRPESDPIGNEEACFTDMFKSAQKLSTLDIEELKLFLDDPVVILRDLDNTIDPKKLKVFLDSASRVEKEEIKEPSKILAQWLLGCKQIQPPESIDHMGHKHLREIILPVVQCYLWEHGFYDLAIIASCYAVPLNEGAAGRSSKAHLDPALAAELAVLYPYIRKDKNEAEISMAYFEEKLKEHRWRRSLPTEMVISVGGSESEYYVTPSSLRNQIASFFIHLNK